MTSGPIAVLDTSALVPVWSRLVLQRLAAEGRFEPVWSEWIIAETWRILARRWLARHGLNDEDALGEAAKRTLQQFTDSRCYLVAPCVVGVSRESRYNHRSFCCDTSSV